MSQMQDTTSAMTEAESERGRLLEGLRAEHAAARAAARDGLEQVEDFLLPSCARKTIFLSLLILPWIDGWSNGFAQRLIYPLWCRVPDGTSVKKRRGCPVDSRCPLSMCTCIRERGTRCFTETALLCTPEIFLYRAWYELCPCQYGYSFAPKLRCRRLVV